MNIILRNILAVIAGLFIGGLVNGLIIKIGPIFIPPPEGVNPEDFKSIKANLHLYNPLQLSIPIFAHAIGTFIGAIAACLIAGSSRLILAMVIGGFFLLGGITACYMMGGPLWFIVVDLLFAYIPMAYLGWKVSGKQ